MESSQNIRNENILIPSYLRYLISAKAMVSYAV